MYTGYVPEQKLVPINEWHTTTAHTPTHTYGKYCTIYRRHHSVLASETPPVEDGGYARLGHRYCLLLHGFVDSYAV